MIDDLIEKLKQSAIDRCRERIIKAREMPKDETVSSLDNHGITSYTKRARGL
jgi:hypothetical protein